MSVQQKWDHYKRWTQGETETHNVRMQHRLDSWFATYQGRGPLPRCQVLYTLNGWTARMGTTDFHYTTWDEATAKAVELVLKGYARSIDNPHKPPESGQ